MQEGDVVLVWGGSGGLGSLAIQIVREWGAIPVAVVSNDERGQYCVELGAKGYINRGDFDHWGMMPHWKDEEGYGTWMRGARAFGAAIWDVLGERKSPRIVIEHPGEDTVPTSMFVCDNRRHSRNLCRHDRLQRGCRPALPLGSTESGSRARTASTMKRP